MPVACLLLPRFELLSALGERRELLRRPLALAPEPGAAQLVGEPSAAAEALGVRSGMRLGEALSRCPELALVPPDPERSDRDWEGVMRRLEGIGAEVEAGRPGEAFFEAGGLRGLWGGLEGVLARAHGAGGDGAARAAAAPGRFCAYAASAWALPRGGPPIVAEGRAREFLAPLPVSLLHGRIRARRGGARALTGADPGAENLPNELERLGIGTLGQLANLPRGAVADRFGAHGLSALELALGEDEPLRPRLRAEEIAAELELPDAIAGSQLERALEMLISRLLAHPGRLNRTLRSLRLSARLAAGGGWRRRVALRSAAADGDRLRIALLPHLVTLPGPAATLRLEVLELGPEAVEQLSMESPERQRRRRLSEAVRQARAAGGPEAVLRVLEVEAGSRLPERRAMLMPFPDERE
ncbi:MAG: hypothetical protein EXQ70_01070 [Solirubrobacterales bacterium]|nr:hypothetical protein [Solirubrobacterales bacterium]